MVEDGLTVPYHSSSQPEHAVDTHYSISPPYSSRHRGHSLDLGKLSLRSDPVHSHSQRPDSGGEFIGFCEGASWTWGHHSILRVSPALDALPWHGGQELAPWGPFGPKLRLMVLTCGCGGAALFTIEKGRNKWVMPGKWWK
ncbi:hypothetical protein BC826DRAFT_1031120 [Russula brevipes]|nr:hypothetical protein BC826DRAFT_1031120 [Russula brevipes]